VGTTLETAIAVLTHPSLHANPVASGKMARRLLADTQLLPLVAAAQQEVAELLTGPTFQQLCSRDQGLLLLLAHRLLFWWSEAQRLWLHNPDRDTLGRSSTAATAEGYYAYHLQAVELAAALAQAEAANCTTEEFVDWFILVAQVRACCLCINMLCL
jgi:hypothetical protein